MCLCLWATSVICSALYEKHSATHIKDAYYFHHVWITVLSLTCAESYFSNIVKCNGILLSSPVNEL